MVRTALLAGMLLLLVLPGCGGGDSADDATSTSTRKGGASRSSSTEDPYSSGSSSTPPTGQRVSFRDLHVGRDDYVGERVDVDGTVFFFETCPPSDETGQAAPCVLTGYLAAPGSTQLNASDLDDAIALSEDGRSVSCSATQARNGACPGWRHAARYRIVATVAHQVLGGRETTYIELEVLSKTPA
jgi:hypothetical protein